LPTESKSSSGSLQAGRVEQLADRDSESVGKWPQFADADLAGTALDESDDSAVRADLVHQIRLTEPTADAELAEAEPEVNQILVSGTALTLRQVRTL
jgi:hypothetical protein